MVCGGLRWHRWLCQNLAARESLKRARLPIPCIAAHGQRQSRHLLFTIDAFQALTNDCLSVSTVKEDRVQVANQVATSIGKRAGIAALVTF